ncbi:hypothetical protein ACFGVR_23625 [Mucilaginibacter sp. AW1-3]
MKKLMILSAMAVSGLIAQSANAQIGIHINLHLGGSPVYVAPQPAPVYADDYYYLPDVEAYYSVRENCYYYNDGYNWVSAVYLPGAYRNYDWHYARRVEIKEARPYLHSEVYRSRYGGMEHRNWNYRDEHDNRMYADHDNHDHGFENRGNARPDNHFDRNNYGRGIEPQRNDHNFNRGPQNQPQQNDNRDNSWNNNRGQQQAQPQQNDNRGGFNRGGQQQTQPQPQQNNDHNNGGGNRGQQQNGNQQGQPAQQQGGHMNGGNNGGQQHFAQNNGPRPTRF